MTRKFVPLVLVVALVCGGSASSAFAGSDPEKKANQTEASTAQPSEGDQRIESSDKLKKDVFNMLAKTRAGKSSLPMPQSQSKRNNLSKGQKIAIIAGIAAVVVIVIVAKHQKDHFLDGFNPGPLF